MSREPLAEKIEEIFRESRKDGMSISACCDMIAAAIRTEILDKIAVAEAEGLSAPNHVMVQSIVGAATGMPLVQCRVGFEQWQWDIAQAREHALAVLQCAEAAMHDAAMLRWLTLSDLGLDKRAAQLAVVELRRFRGDVENRDWRVPDE